MAKARKPKNDESKTENSGAVVRHQKLCLSIDMDKRQIYGYTELEIAVPDIGIVGLHAENLGIDSVLVDGEPAAFEYYPYHQNAENEKRWNSISSPGSAADAAVKAYLSALKRELVPNLLINCCKPFKGLTVQMDQLNLESKLESAGETKENVKLVRIDYWVEKAETGVHFDGNVLHTNNQIRRARCWFPCIDDNSQRCCYDLEFTVPNNLIAVSTGSLLYQVLSKDDPPRKTYVYRLDVPVAARWITLAVAPFHILPDQHHCLISHMCLPTNLSKLRNTVEFFHNAFRHYETYLDAKFPFGSYKQVFLAPEMAVSSSTFGASMSIFSSQVLYDEKVIDQAIDTSIKLAFTLAKQWFGVYITPEAANDEWLLDGLAGFLSDSFIKKFLGNNEVRYRRYKVLLLSFNYGNTGLNILELTDQGVLRRNLKDPRTLRPANCAVCKADDSGATALSSSNSCQDLYGTQCIGIYGRIRSCKSVAILQMLEKQMGSNFFRKILQNIVSRAQGATSPVRSLSTKEFRHFANKVGNLERPFLKEFFPRWVGSCGCPVLRMGFSYNKRKNIIELAVLRECTAMPDASAPFLNSNPDPENREGGVGWPGVMSIRVHELDGMYDHPVLPMSGDTWQLLEIQCHSKLAARRSLKPKKGSKPDGSDDNGDAVAALDMRTSTESPLSWIRADPEMEFLAEIHFNQPVQMWINQLEKDGDVVAQSQAIAALESLPNLSFSIINTLNNFLSDSKAFWRVRIEAAFALANTASEETDWAGLLHLVKFYKSRRFDSNIGLPKPNDFRDFPEYFVLEAIPHAIATVRTADKKSPREAVEFVLQLLKYNDNNGNPYSDVFWLAALVQSVGELEFGQQSILFLSSLLKRVDRLLQFDRLMPSYNGILTISCIRTLTQIALKLSGFICLDNIIELVKPFRGFSTLWHIRVEASRALLDLEFHCKGLNAALLLFVKYIEEEPSLRGQVKLAVHAMRLCQIRSGSDSDDEISTETLLALLHLLENRIAFNNVFLRHHLFSILQILAGRAPSLYGVPRDKINEEDIFAAPFAEIRHVAAPVEIPSQSQENFAIPPNTSDEPHHVPNGLEGNTSIVLELPEEDTPLVVPEISREVSTVPNGLEPIIQAPEVSKEITNTVPKSHDIPEASKEVDTVSHSNERKMAVKIRVKRSTTNSKAEETDNKTFSRSQGGGGHHEHDHGTSSSVSVDAPPRHIVETVSLSYQNIEEVNSCHDRGSRMTASIGSARLPSEGDNFGKELQCTADSSKVSLHHQPYDLPSSPNIMQDNDNNVDEGAQKYVSLQTLSVTTSYDVNGSSLDTTKVKEKKKDKKRKKDDPEYLEKKRLKKERKRKEKEIAKLLSKETKAPSSIDMPVRKEELGVKTATVQLKQPNEPSGSEVMVTKVESRPKPSEGSPAPKFRIKIKSRTQNNP